MARHILSSRLPSTRSAAWRISPSGCTVAWGDQAETIQRSVTKGALLFVQGHFTPHQYTTEDGKQAVNLEVNVEKFSFADESKPEGNGEPRGDRARCDHSAHPEHIPSTCAALSPCC